MPAYGSTDPKAPEKNKPITECHERGRLANGSSDPRTGSYLAIDRPFDHPYFPVIYT